MTRKWTVLSVTMVSVALLATGFSIAADDDGHPGIYVALTEAAETMRRGGGVGCATSRAEPQRQG